MNETAGRRKGTLILTEGRSGSNWLGSLTKATGVLGNSEEWFAKWAWPKKLKNATPDTYINSMISKASTSNGYFCAKIFPAHAHYFNVIYGQDLVQNLIERFDCNIVMLDRRDRMRQAVSYARGIQTAQWKSSGTAKREATYDAMMIARCFFLVNQSYEFWRNYTTIRDIKVTCFTYEDLIGAPDAYVRAIAKHAGESVDNIAESPLKIQRDEITEVWLTRFQNDLPRLNITAAASPQRWPRPNLSNLWRLLTGKPLKPYPYTY
jgi:trehalose 2-sulfotransferase